MGAGRLVELKRRVAQRAHGGGAHQRGAGVKGNVLVVFAGAGFGGWREQGRGQAVAIDQAARQGDAADGAGARVIPPAAAGEVAARDAFQRQWGGGAAQHHAPMQALALGVREVWHVRHVR